MLEGYNHHQLFDRIESIDASFVKGVLVSAFHCLCHVHLRH